MVQLRRPLYERRLLRERRVIGGSIWSTILGGLKKFIGSDTGKQLIRTGISTAAEHAPGLLSRAWNWIKGRVTGEESKDVLPPEVTSLAKKAGNKAQDKAIEWVDRMNTRTKNKEDRDARIAATEADTSIGDFTGALPEGFGIKRGRRGKGLAPLGAGATRAIGTGLAPLGAGMSPLGMGPGIVYGSAIPSAGRHANLTEESKQILSRLVGNGKKSGSGVKIARR